MNQDSNDSLAAVLAYLKGREASLINNQPRRQYDGYLEGVWDGQTREVDWAIDFVASQMTQCPSHH